jgi:hypothetical protein
VIDVLYASPWPGIGLWALLFISDLNLTMICARMYQAGVREYIVFEGSYELTPYHQKDVDAQRRFSPQFLIALVAACTLMALLWRVTIGESSLGVAYEVMLGMLILSQLTIHVRHLRNYFLFRQILAGTGVSGRIEYARPAILTNSAVELFSFAALYAILFALTTTWFLLGGAFACAILGLKHQQLARQAAVRPAMV